jgi:hypothetical protein
MINMSYCYIINIIHETLVSEIIQLSFALRASFASRHSVVIQLYYDCPDSYRETME